MAVAHIFQRNEKIARLQRARVDRDAVDVPRLRIEQTPTRRRLRIFRGPQFTRHSSMLHATRFPDAAPALSRGAIRDPGADALRLVTPWVPALRSPASCDARGLGRET